MVLGGVFPDTPIVSVIVLVITTGVIWLGSGWLEGAADQLSTYYGLPAVVQGSIVVAIGSSFPELVTVVVTALAGVSSMGIGSIVGSGIFNILVIPAVAGISSGGVLDSNRTIVYKEAQFYMIAVAALVVTFALAVIYFPSETGPVLVGQLTRPLALIPLLLYALYLFIQWQDVSDHIADDAGGEIAVGRNWAKLVGGLLLILVAVEQLVGAVESLGQTFGIPEFLAGVTVIAAATSLPDLLVSVRTAQADNDITSLGNVLGSNTFDLLVAIPIGALIVGSVPVDFAVAVPMLGVLTLATVLLFTFLRTDLSITNLEAYALLVAYGLFVIWVIAETVGVTHLLKVT